MALIDELINSINLDGINMDGPVQLLICCHALMWLLNCLFVLVGNEKGNDLLTLSVYKFPSGSCQGARREHIVCMEMECRTGLRIHAHSFGHSIFASEIGHNSPLSSPVGPIQLGSVGNKFVCLMRVHGEATLSAGSPGGGQLRFRAL